LCHHWFDNRIQTNVARKAGIRCQGSGRVLSRYRALLNTQLFMLCKHGCDVFFFVTSLYDQNNHGKNEKEKRKSSINSVITSRPVMEFIRNKLPQK
jgi:hypothetical protein